MFFGKGNNYRPMNNSDINLLVKNVLSLKNYCDSKNIKFLFVYTPSKEVVYSDLIPNFPTINFYSLVSKKLSNLGIKGVNSYLIFKEFRKKSSRKLYHNDDTHWNKLAVDLVTTEMADLIVN